MKYVSKFLSVFLALLFFAEVHGHHPNYKQIATLTPKLPGIDILGDSFGQVLFANDEFLFVGAPIATVKGKKISGAVYVYKKKHDDHWERTQIITTGGLLDHLSALKIYADKKWLFIAAVGTPIGPIPNDIPANQDFTGSILIYKWEDEGKKWKFSQSIDRHTKGLEHLTFAAPGAVTPPPVPFLLVENGATFGVSFDINAEKGLLLVGAPGQMHDSFMNSGTVFAFKLHHNNHWKLIQKFTNPDGHSENDSFGGQVVLHKKYALIGNSLNTTPHINQNSSVYLYHFKNDKWHFVQKVQGDGENTLVQIGVFGGDTPFSLSPNFGASIAADKGWVIIGAPYENLGTDQLKGAVYFYELIGKKGHKKLERRQKFTSDDPNTLFTGIAVAIEGETAVAGDPGHVGPHGEQAQGGLLVFRRKDNVWIKTDVLFDKFGFPFQLFGNGVTIKDRFIIGGVGNAVIGEVILTAVPQLLPLPTPLAQNRAVIWKHSH